MRRKMGGSVSRVLKMTLVFVSLVSVSGCKTLLHELQPHRLWRWNYSDSQGRTDEALFSVDDPLTAKKAVQPPVFTSVPRRTSLR